MNGELAYCLISLQALLANHKSNILPSLDSCDISGLLRQDSVIPCHLVTRHLLLCEQELNPLTL